MRFTQSRHDRKNFHVNGPKTGGSSEPFSAFFLYQPAVFKELVPRVTVDTSAGAALTRQRVDAALRKATYSIVDSSPLAAHIEELGNRSEIRAEKFASRLRSISASMKLMRTASSAG